jgi:anthranilate/para-aminobenzoate synthase component I
MESAFDIAADLDTPVSAYLKLEPFTPRFLLESVEGGEAPGRYSFIGFGDVLEVQLRGASFTVGEKEESTLPAELTVSAYTSDGEIMGIRHASLPAEGIQFHPESVLTPRGDRLLENFLDFDPPGCPS